MNPNDQRFFASFRTTTMGAFRPTLFVRNTCRKSLSFDAAVWENASPIARAEISFSPVGFSNSLNIEAVLELLGFNTKVDQIAW
jgi:hypothetical protein